MSCSICGQDVPVVPAADDAEIVTCMQCHAKLLWKPAGGATLRREPRHGPTSASAGESPRTQRTQPSARPPVIAQREDWDENDRREPRESDIMPSTSPPIYRRDRVDSDTTAPAPAQRKRRPRSHWLQWTILSLGVALFSCGATLVAWSFGDDHHHLWNIGAPLALAGQAAFLIGLVLQLEVIWQQSKQTSRRLENLDRRVAPVPTSALATPPAVDAGSGIGPTPTPDAESLLKELKGQLDQMATRLMRPKW